jgi:hypothetical protein
VKVSTLAARLSKPVAEPDRTYMMIGGPARAPLPEAQTGISNHGWGRRTEPKTNIHANGAGKLAGGPAHAPRATRPTRQQRTAPAKRL